MKPRARFTPRLNTWAFWLPPDGWQKRTVGFGYTLEEAMQNWWLQAVKWEVQALFLPVGRFGGGRFGQ